MLSYSTFNISSMYADVVQINTHVTGKMRMLMVKPVIIQHLKAIIRSLIEAEKISPHSVLIR